MTDSAFDFGEQSSLRDVTYRLYPPMWTANPPTGISLDIDQWTTIKYLNASATDLNTDVNTIPNDKGGLYLFWIKCKIIPGITEYPFYVGRAKLTAHQNLRKRIREYFPESKKTSCRPKIKKMFKYWSNELMVSYITVANNSNTDDYEKKLINSLLLPFNSQIPDTDISQSVQAFQL